MAGKSKGTTKFPIFNIFQLLEHKKLWLNPEYQRDAVWVDSQKRLLIDSLIRGIDIPKLYFREKENSDYEFEVVDGQQRLRAIEQFMRDDLTIDDQADDVGKDKIAGKKYSELDLFLRMKFTGVNLDIVIFEADYSDEQVKDTFLRLQNGSILKAAEKRRALPGNMSGIVRDLSKHPVFALCGFKDSRFAYEDVAAKILHLLIHGDITDIGYEAIRTTYKNNAKIKDSHAAVQRTIKAFRTLEKAFKNGPSPQFKRFSLLTTTYLTVELMENYNLSKHLDEFAKAYIQFELTRRENEELPEGEQDPRLVAYTAAARSDRIPEMRYRHELLREAILKGIPELTLKDPTRSFSDEQRQAIYWRDKGICKICDAKCEHGAFHADHIIPHDNGGETKLSNGQLLCPKCNLTKGNKQPLLLQTL